MLGDAKCEILVACDDDRKVYIYDADGVKLKEFGLSWGFSGCRYTDSATRHDPFVVGDVMGDAYADIVMIDQNGMESVVRVYDANGAEQRPSFKVYFTPYDGVTLGDVHGNGKKELLIATGDGDGRRGCAIRPYDVSTGSMVRYMSWPVLTKYDGFACGDIQGTGKDQVIVVTDEDNRHDWRGLG